MKKSLLMESLAVLASQGTAVPNPQASPAADLPPPADAEALGLLHTLDSHVRRSKVDAVKHAWSRLRQLLKVRQPLTLSQQAPKVTEWFFECDDHYIDVVRDSMGKYSVYFRDRTDNNSEGWLDQDDAPLNPETMREMFETHYGQGIEPARLLWRDEQGNYKSTLVQNAWVIWKQAYVSMSNRISPSVIQWTSFATEKPKDGTAILWRTLSHTEVGTGYYCAEDGAYWEGEWLPASAVHQLPTKDSQ